jgi:hypothetical protein
MHLDDPSLRFLLASQDPSIRFFALTDLLDLPQSDPEVASVKKLMPGGPRIKALMAGQKGAKRRSAKSLATHEGGFGVHPYKKWDGAHWRLVSAVELGIPTDYPGVRTAADQVLTWLSGESHRKGIQKIKALTRRCGSQEGNALAVCCRLGLVDDSRVHLLARSLVEWQWPDGGWNCDVDESAHHSSFYETLPPLWGLTEYHRLTGDGDVLRAVDRASEFFLRHRLFRGERTGKVINAEWLKLHYPLYWHYDLLQGLVVLGRAGKLGDPRAGEALELLEQKRQIDGCWHVEGRFWEPVGRRPSNIDVVDWGMRGPNEMITLNAMRVLKAAGRLPVRP